MRPEAIDASPLLDPCAEAGVGPHACDTVPLERLRFWDGRFLVARDLRDEQAALIRRLEYHQRFAHGAGILCGFHVGPHPREDCRPEWVIVTPGMAYDCCGRTLWMTERRAVRVFAEPGTRDERESKTWERFLVARRCERLTDPVPALYAEDLCDPVRREYGRVLEDVELVVVTRDEVPDDCWPSQDPLTRADCDEVSDDDCDEALGETPPCDAHCACGHGVILARLIRAGGTAAIEIDTTYRSVLTPPSGLTHVTGINWPHGGEVSLDDLRDTMNGELVVRFSRPLRSGGGEARGINRQTFTVSYLGQSGNPEHILPPDPEDRGPDEAPSPRLSANACCAVFTLPEDLLRGRTSVRNTTLHITLRCDFIEDCHGRLVSGAHPHGDVDRWRSAPRVAGGRFESWFYVA